jgi:hypothetical protein
VDGSGREIWVGGRENEEGCWLAVGGGVVYIARTGCEATHCQGWHH